VPLLSSVGSPAGSLAGGTWGQHARLPGLLGITSRISRVALRTGSVPGKGNACRSEGFAVDHRLQQPPMRFRCVAFGNRDHDLVSWACISAGPVLPFPPMEACTSTPCAHCLQHQALQPAGADLSRAYPVTRSKSQSPSAGHPERHELFCVPPPDFKISCAIQLMHAGSSSGRPDRPGGL
jgi:hypothetical protein